MPELRTHGVAVYGITAQPGNVRSKLAAEGVFVDFPITNDPEGALVVPDACILGQIDTSRSYYIKDQKQEYMPALFVTDSEGHVKTWWSWKRLGAQLLDRVAQGDVDKSIEGEFDPGLVEVDVGAFGMVASENSKQTGAKKTWIVNVRPRAADLVSAILDERPFQLEEALSTNETLAAHLKSNPVVPYDIPESFQPMNEGVLEGAVEQKCLEGNAPCNCTVS